jgi:hypothetical protein
MSQWSSANDRAIDHKHHMTHAASLLWVGGLFTTVAAGEAAVKCAAMNAVAAGSWSLQSGVRGPVLAVSESLVGIFKSHTTRDPTSK